MKVRSSRRRFLRSAAAVGGLHGLGEITGLEHLVADDQGDWSPRDWSLRYAGDIEPLVRLMEETPLEECIERLAAKLKAGLSYRQFVTALFLAGLRNGGDSSYYHCIYMIHSAHYLSLGAPLDERIMGMFGGLGAFKNWQARRYDGDAHFGWRKKPTKLPSPSNALKQFRAAITSEDPDGAEAAIIALAQSASPQQLLDVIMPYTLGDGVHGWICVSNSFRIFPVIGWRHAEPALRMMARSYAGSGHWSTRWLAPRVAAAAKKLGALADGWTDARGDRSATLECVSVLRGRNHEAAFDFVYEQLARGKIRAGSVWDAVHLIAAERYSLIKDLGDALHQNTGTNALHYAFRTCVDPQVRLMTLMRAVTWTAKWGIPRNIKESQTLVQLTPADIPALPLVAAEEIVSCSPKQDDAIGKAFAFARQHPHSPALRDAQRRLVFSAVTDGHSYKYLAAIHEDCDLVSRTWRPHMIASSLAGGGGIPPESPIILQAREALGST